MASSTAWVCTRFAAGHPSPTIPDGVKITLTLSNPGVLESAMGYRGLAAFP